MAIVVAVFIYLAFSAASSVQSAPAASTNDAIAEDVDNGLLEAPPSTIELDAAEASDGSPPSTLPANIRQYLVERYYSETANENAQCVGAIWSFEPDGTFEITAADDRQITRGLWTLSRDRLAMTEISVTDMDSQTIRPESDAEIKISWHDGILIMGSIALYSCRL
ncbi:hypothetical protein M2336_000301 [Sphingobium sp. B1D7B]|uniref:hypothetical protein n=1 Tax=Sphingobium sp. B1D7B TaxID=2940578 RepID=UPI002225928F|nr:hypothetical protein [Sphingobium sp. B1D7B]MCW2403672.1 hypothetical protein [Sphingobium sp. B1D7B]